jgi:hypothetical protein|tara:strand:+ start:201 stop:365 length:165 start_codon:yes stop_codon:yes gene_type:complete
MKDGEIKFVEISENQEGLTTIKLTIKPDLYSSIFEYGFISLLEKSVKNVDPFWE